MQYDIFHSVSSEQLQITKSWQAQYRLVMEWGKLITVKPTLREISYLISGCEAKAWLVHEVCNGRHRFLFDSESRIINGFAAWILSLIDNKTSEELQQLNIKQLLIAAGLEKHLTPSRNNGLRAIVLRAYALAGVDIKFE